MSKVKVSRTTRRQEWRLSGLSRRVARLERALGSLLIYLAARDLIGPEDFRTVQEELRVDAAAEGDAA